MRDGDFTCAICGAVLLAMTWKRPENGGCSTDRHQGEQLARDSQFSRGTFLHRDDLTTRFITTGTSISDGTTPMAAIDWDAAVTALASGGLP